MDMIEKKERVFLLKLALLALVMRFFIGTAYYNIFISALKSPLYAFDGEVYSIMGWYIALVLKGVNFASLPASLIPNDYVSIGGIFGTIANFKGMLPPLKAYGVGIYSYMIGVFYYIFGYAPVLLRFVNSVISVGSAFIVYKIARPHFGEKCAKASFVITLFLPTAVVYSASLQKDAIINFLVIFGIFQVMKILESDGRGVRKILDTALFLAAFLLLLFLKQNGALVILAGAFLAVFFTLRKGVRRLTVLLTIAACSIPPVFTKVAGLIKAGIAEMLHYHHSLTYLGGYTIKILPERFYPYTDAMTAWWLAHNIDAWTILTAYAKGLMMFFFEPSIATAYTPQHLLVLPYMIFWYALVIFAVAGVWDALKRSLPAGITLFVFLFVFTSAMALSEANAEALIRHRDMIVPVYIIFAASGIGVLKGMIKRSGAQ